jgi:predicted Mrr-cat superfamily restriction endonuclease
LLEIFKITSLPNNEPPLRTKYWQISLGEDATKWDEWKKNNIIVIGFKEVIQSAGEKILEMSDDEIKKHFRDSYPENSNPDEETDKIINFLNKMKEGDKVLIEQGGSDVGWGIIKSDLIFGNSQDFSVYRQIEWKNTPIQKSVPDDIEV